MKRDTGEKITTLTTASWKERASTYTLYSLHEEDSWELRLKAERKKNTQSTSRRVHLTIIIIYERLSRCEAKVVRSSLA